MLFHHQKDVCIIPAHDGPLAALVFNSTGSKLASASEKVSEHATVNQETSQQFWLSLGESGLAELLGREGSDFFFFTVGFLLQSANFERRLLVFISLHSFCFKLTHSCLVLSEP